MSWDRVWVIVRKEWREVIHNRTIVFTFIGLSAMFTIMPLLLAFGMPKISPELLGVEDETVEMSDLPPGLADALPGYATLEPLEQFQVFMLRQFLVFFLVLPVMGAISIATYSIIGEKTSRSLEALLATPIRTDELLVGKTLASSVPAVLATWVAFGCYAVMVVVLGGASVAHTTLDVAALALITLMVPLVALLGLGLGVVVSSRSTDARSAQQIAGIVVIPLVVVVIGQSAGVIMLGVEMVVAAALVLLVVDALVLALGVRVFDREAILTRWK
ncbi:MAG: ABC transporter permease subunit [Anaerolineae bacterium]